MFTIIKTGGKQYKVSEGSKIKVEKIGIVPGEFIDIKNVLLKSDGEDVFVGTPYVENCFVKARVVSHGKDEKKIVFRYHPKTRYRKKKGHSQPHTILEVIKVS